MVCMNFIFPDLSGCVETDQQNLSPPRPEGSGFTLKRDR